MISSMSEEQLTCSGVMKRPCEDSSSAESEVDVDMDVDVDSSVYPRLVKVRMITCGSSQTTTQVMARKKRRGIIEKRRRDRINNSLSELRRLVPTAFEKQASAKLEKAEILQMTVDHLKMLQVTGGKGYFDAHALALDFLSLGFRECVTEVSHYLSTVEGVASGDPLHSRLLTHLTSCASQRDITAALTVASYSPHRRQHPPPPPPPFPHPPPPPHWVAFRPLPTAASYGLSGLPVPPDAGGGGAPQRLTELPQPSVTSSCPSQTDSTSSSFHVFPCGSAPPSTSLLSLSAASFPLALHGGFPLFPPISSSSSSQTPPQRPWGAAVGVF